MAKQIIYFNATKQIETITIHYNIKLDGTFVDDVAQSIKDIAKKMSRVDLKKPKEFDSIKVFIYPSKQLFYKIFGGEIEKRFYSRRRSLEDLYVVQDAEGNIHIVSPRGMAQEKRDEFKKILVMKVLGEYMEEKEKQSALRLLKEAMKPKEEEIEEPEELDEVVEEEIEEQEVEEIEDEVIEQEEIEEVEVEDELELEQDEEPEQELDEEELEEIIETELVLEQIDEKQQADDDIVDSSAEQTSDETKQEDREKKTSKRSEAQEWLNVGWLAYINGRLKKEADIKRFAQNISVNGIKKLGQLSNTRLLESYNFSREYACAWVEYIVTTYGMKKFIEHYENPKDIKGVFGVSKFVFEAQLKSYIKEKYKGDNKTLNITEDINLDEIVHEQTEEKEEQSSIAELTILHFSATGGVDIVTVEPIEKAPMSIDERT